MWAQRLENDGNDYVYASSDDEGLKCIDDCSKKSDLIYEASQLSCKGFGSRRIDSNIEDDDVRIYCKRLSIEKVYIAFTIGIDRSGRKSPAFFYMEDKNGIDFSDEGQRRTILDHIIKFAELIGRRLDDITEDNIKQALNKLCQKISKKKRLTLMLIVIGSAVLIAIAMILKMVSKGA